MDERDALACLKAAKAAGLTAGQWAREHGVDGRSLNAWRIITSQIDVKKWHDYVGEPTMADAILDQHGHVERTGVGLRVRWHDGATYTLCREDRPDVLGRARSRPVVATRRRRFVAAVGQVGWDPAQRVWRATMRTERELVPVTLELDEEAAEHQFALIGEVLERVRRQGHARLVEQAASSMASLYREAWIHGNGSLEGAPHDDAFGGLAWESLTVSLADRRIALAVGGRLDAEHTLEVPMSIVSDWDLTPLDVRWE